MYSRECDCACSNLSCVSVNTIHLQIKTADSLLPDSQQDRLLEKGRLQRRKRPDDIACMHFWIASHFKTLRFFVSQNECSFFNGLLSRQLIKISHIYWNHLPLRSITLQVISNNEIALCFAFGSLDVRIGDCIVCSTQKAWPFNFVILPRQRVGETGMLRGQRKTQVLSLWVL